jgi:cysteine desulfurase
VEAMMPYLTTQFGNPSSSHYYGKAPRDAIHQARKSILSLLYPSTTITKWDDVKEHKAIIFTGCGTEADNLAIHLALEQCKPSQHPMTKKHIVTSNVEHPAVEQYLKALQGKNQIDVTYVPVNKEGMVDAKDVIQAIQPNTVLVTLMLANNESGALQPVQEVSSYCRQHGVLFHTDAAQAVGKVSVALEEDHGIGSNVDMITIVGHKFGGPKGVACLYVNPDCSVVSSHGMLLGGGQEHGQRAGTENVPYIVALGKACSLLMEHHPEYKKEQWKVNAERMERLRCRLLDNLISSLGSDMVRVNGPKDPSRRLPNTLSVGLKGIQSGALLEKIQMKVACSAGSACHSSGGTLSSVLVAMKVPLEYARGTLRLSIGPTTTDEEVDVASHIIAKEVKCQLQQ